MKKFVIFLGMLLFLAFPVLRAQSASVEEESAAGNESADTETSDEAVAQNGTAIIYTMTAGTDAAAGRVLLSSLSENFLTASNTEDQTGKSGPRVVPSEYALHQNYPNPFNPTTTLRFDLPVQAQVTLKVYNILGQEVADALNGEQLEAGSHEVRFDASRLASGVYTYRMDAIGNDRNSTKYTRIKKMVLVK